MVLNSIPQKSPSKRVKIGTKLVTELTVSTKFICLDHQPGRFIVTWRAREAVGWRSKGVSMAQWISIPNCGRITRMVLVMGKVNNWLGNDMLHDITRSGSYDLYVIAKDFNDENQYKRFGGFTIGSEATKYRFHYESVCPGYSPHNLFVLSLIMKFSTADQDNDTHATLNCAESFKGGWWFTECHSDHMNGQYSYTAECPYATGLHWHSWQNGYKCLKETMLLIKEQPSSCT